MTAHILVIDDSEIIQAALRDMLGLAGYRVTTVGSASAGLVTLAGVRADLVLLDMLLPDGNGLEVLRAIAKSPYPPPVILMSAYPSTEGGVATLAEVRSWGARHFLAKPFDLDHLLAVVREALGEPEA